ncbi:hypothetical protein PHLGIDRAFT_121452 [Phlebiopsis gigantea 11061_1 CR5-6]|uniref:Uncharacterized protein n=1 Tax=Phlebiopsis gigantea (strain 11061_1 CR5-6) TaxID=745531 RepID=A0A0C3S249_PHLG1|nr:hypothetical protein PHLGIDRAFT_121452 [Phlebiopsis gigantea 11061_1 CR5-6]
MHTVIRLPQELVDTILEHLWHTTTYAFSVVSHNAVVVTPTSTDSSQGLYHIAVYTNVFKAQTPVTVIRRGSSEDSPIVAETMLNGHAADGKITFGGQTKKLNKAVKWKYKVFKNDRVSEMRWTFSEQKLVWKLVQSGEDMLYECSTLGGGWRSSRTHVATMRLSKHYDGRQAAELTIDVPESEITSDLLDHMIVSSLVFQRGQDDGKRLKEESKAMKVAVNVLSTVMTGVPSF